MATLLLLALAPLASTDAEASTPLYATIEGKRLVAISEINEYVVRAIGGPGEGAGGNYSFIATITGPQVKNALVSPGDGISKNGIFHFNVTSPEVAQDVTITVNITSYTSPQDYVKVTKQIYIQVVGPVIISAKVVNNGNMALVGVPITFYADGVQLYKTNISLEALSSKTVIYNWTQQDISNGEHLVTVELDPNNQFVRFEGGGTVFTQTVYVGGINYSNTDAILIMVFFLLLLVSYFVYKRPKKRRKK